MEGLEGVEGLRGLGSLGLRMFSGLGFTGLRAEVTII